MGFLEETVLMLMLWTFKLSFSVDKFTFVGHFVQVLGEILIHFMVTLEETDLRFALSKFYRLVRYLNASLGH